MYKIIAAILLNMAGLISMNIAVAGDHAGEGECAVMCSLPVDLAGAE